ncbi:MAG: iron-containing alcohol dehydrogenase [Dehalococcoidia bacterium]|nr:iron-containing alcohol dehydrogenase [Dehalococcoidia bacterium]MDD5494957.1 iron-containing alcohol dehydrogenase [Dehalococcoidia bacterium]
MSITRFYLPTRFIVGPGSLNNLGKEASRFGDAAILVTGRASMRRTGVLEKVIKGLEEKGVKSVIFDEVEPNPRSSTIDKGAQLARKSGARMVIGLGGGSSMDAAKCIALASSGSESIWSHYEKKVSVTGGMLPIILVPTVTATGSEGNNGAVLTNWETHEKVVIFNDKIYPAVSIVDPALTLSVPAKTTARGGVDIFCHLVEYYISAHETTLINDSIREACMRTVVETLPQVLAKPADIEGRSRLSWACTMACSQFTWTLGGGTGLTPMHGIQHPLSAIYDIAHGDGLATLLIAWMKHTLPAREERFKALGQNVFGETDGIVATEKWLAKIGMNIRLRDLGVKEADFDELVSNALRTAPWVTFNPTPLGAPEIKAVYKKSY